MNLSVLALMLAIAAAFFGLLGYALVHGEPFLLIGLAAVAAIAFAPWHRRR